MRRLVPLLAMAVLAGVVPAASQQEVAGLPACGRSQERGAGGPVNVDLATVTDTVAVLTWLTCDSQGRPSATKGTVEYGLLSDPTAWRSINERKPVAFHLQRIAGLRPGTQYGYRVSANGLPAPPGRLSPGVFVTLTPPPGRELFRFAVLADTHIGEQTAGLALSSPVHFPPAYEPRRPYSAPMLDAAVREVNRRSVALALQPGDASSHGELHQLRLARGLLERLDAPYLVAPGPHDRPNQYSRARAECPPDGDCFRVVFRPRTPASKEPHVRPASVTRMGWDFIALDSGNLRTGSGELPAGELAWLRARLEAAKRLHHPAIIFLHHPLSEYATATTILPIAATTNVPPVFFTVNPADAETLLDTIAGYDVRMVISGHTHRNWITYSPRTGRMPLVEVGPTKEYPGGYSIFRVYEGGILREWWPIDCTFCNAWRETTRGEYLSAYPLYTIGSLRDRSFVHSFDGPDVPGVPSLPLGLWPPLEPRNV